MCPRGVDHRDRATLDLRPVDPMKWLQRWIHSLIAWLTPPETRERLDRIEKALARAMPSAAQMPANHVADCGHEAQSWFQDVEHGYTRCPACHDKHIQENLSADSA